MNNQEIQFYLAVDDNSERYFVGKKNDEELYCIGNITDVNIISNSSENELKLVGECFRSENEMCNRLINGKIS
ncbi:hypothetical protein [Clostridium sp.]|uniref:hypothetical protein n=1 Tax=Clostridium sp. TaxID=1506 RepID=UPI002628B818|nr:hypothetical protein [Clostridium sp.]